MKNRVFILSLFLLGLFLAGCSEGEGPLPADVAPLSVEDQSALKAAKKHAVPFKCEFEMWGVPIDDPNPDNPDDLVHQMLWGAGKASHMGKTEILIPDEGLDFSFFPTASADNVEVILTAANGDELWFRYSSEFDLSPMLEGETGVIIVEDADGEIWGGTGRFKGATGEITYEGVWPFTEWGGEFGAGTCTFNGTIKY